MFCGFVRRAAVPLFIEAPASSSGAGALPLHPAAFEKAGETFN